MRFLWLCLFQTVVWYQVYGAVPSCNTTSADVEVDPTQPVDSILIDLNLYCTDPDVEILTYTIQNGNEDGFFQMDTGQLQLAKAIPGQIPYKYSVEVHVTDSTPVTVTLFVNIKIKFNDNENDPVITGYPTTFNIPESEPVGTRINVCSVSDADQPKNTLAGVTRVRIINKVYAKKFTLDSVTCELFVHTELDFEKIPQYTIGIEAYDLDPYNPRKSNKTMVVYVQDVNDNYPSCEHYDKLISITSSQAIGQQISKLNCTDPDSGVNGQISYSLAAENSAAISNLFEIEPSAGILKLKASIPDTTTPFYEVVLSVKDSGTPSLERKVLVRIVVTDATGPPPAEIDRAAIHPALPNNHIPVSTANRTAEPRTNPPSIPNCRLNSVTLPLSEYIPVGSELYDLQCTDPDGQPLTYKIDKGDTYSHFEIVNGVLKLKKVLNADFAFKRSLIIGVSDVTGLSVQVDIGIYITNENDFPPVIKNLPSVIQVPEDQPIGAIVNRCTINEKDSKSLIPGGQTRVAWTSTSPDTQKWFLDSVTCDLYVNTVLDYETTKSYSLELSAWDLDPTSPNTVSSTFTVSILDVNDNPPVCPPTYDVTVPEDTAIGTVLETVACTDADSGENAKIYFSIDDSNIELVKTGFTVGGASGQVKVQAGLDFETITSYEVKVKVYDGGEPSLGTTSTVRVAVTDVADGTTAQNTSTPNYSAKPTLDINVVGTSPKQYEFLCNFPLDTAPLWYLVNWYIDNHNIYTTSRISGSDDVLDKTKLTEANLKSLGIDRVGFDIKCDFRPSFGSDTHLGDASASDEKFIGIRVLTPEVELMQGEEGVVTVEVTAPIGCVSGSCSYPLYTFVQQKGYDCALSQASVPCGVNIDTNNAATTYNVRIKGGVTFQYGKGFSESILKIRSPENYADHPIWSNYELDDVKVKVKQDTTLIQGSKCAAFVDPRIVTFDRGLLDLQETGIFTLYSNDDTQSEVQIESYKCDEVTGAHCVCGIALRTGKTVFKLTRCDNIGMTDISYKVCGESNEDILKMETLEKFYQTTFPSGTRVKIFLRPNNMNLFIYPSVMDIGKSRGLCGNLSGTTDDDLVLRGGGLSTKKVSKARFESASDFFESWRVADTDSNNLFNIEPNNAGDLDVYTGSTYVYDAQDYSCNPIGNPLTGRTGVIGDNACSIFTDVGRIQNDLEEGFRVVEKKNCQPTNKRRRRRSVPVKRETLSYIEESSNSRAKRSLTWRNGWTNESAHQFCNDLFNESSMVSLCKDLSLVDVTSSLIACYQDIELSGSANYSLDTMSAIRSQCIHEIDANDTFKIPETPGQSPTYDLIKAAACPGECTQLGTCVDGKCDCNDGYGGIDCSVDITVNPLLVTLENGGHCDRSEDDCTRISAFGETFVAGEKMRCRTKYFELNLDNEMMHKETKQHSPFLESISEAICELPPLSAQTTPDGSILAYGFEITLTNDGKAYSDPTYMAIYNTQCQTCNISREGVSCSLSTGYCVSGGICYQYGDTYKDNECYVCQEGTTSGWTRRKDEICVEEEGEGDEDSMLWVIGAVLAVVISVIITVIVVIFVIKRKNKISASQTDLIKTISVRKLSKP